MYQMGLRSFKCKFNIHSRPSLHLTKECSSPNVKVRNASLHFVGEIHSQLGPMVRALILANNTVEQSVKDQVINKIESCPMDPKAASVARERSCNIPGQKEKNSNSLGNQLSIHIPKTDIVACLPSDCITRMVRKLIYFYFWLLLQR